MSQPRGAQMWSGRRVSNPRRSAWKADVRSEHALWLNSDGARPGALLEHDRPTEPSGCRPASAAPPLGARRCSTVGAASMVGEASEHGQEQEEGDHHEKAAPAAPDGPTKAETKAKSKAMFD